MRAAGPGTGGSQAAAGTWSEQDMWVLTPPIERGLGQVFGALAPAGTVPVNQRSRQPLPLAAKQLLER